MEVMFGGAVYRLGQSGSTSAFMVREQPVAPTDEGSDLIGAIFSVFAIVFLIAIWYRRP